MRGYVRPDKVLKRIDLKEMPHSRNNRIPYNSHSNSLKGLETIYNSNLASSSSFASRKINIIKSDPKLGPTSISKTISPAWSGLEQKAKSEKKLSCVKPLNKETDVSRIARNLMKNSQGKELMIQSNKDSEDEMYKAKRFF